MTQLGLSRAIGHKGNSAHQWETGKNLPLMGTMQKIAEVTATSVEWLLNGDGGDAPVTVATDQERNVLDMFRQLSPQDQAAAEAIILALSNKIT